MCCFFLTLMFLCPRIGFLVYWLLAPVRVNPAINAFNFPWLVGIAGLIFLPWTVLMYTIVFPLNGWNWLFIGRACDIFTYAGGAEKRRSVPYYPETAP
jgi:hypothetical protein